MFALKMTELGLKFPAFFPRLIFAKNSKQNQTLSARRKVDPKMAAKIQTVPEAVAAGLQTLRNEQRQLANKLSELQMDLNEHK